MPSVVSTGEVTVLQVTLHGSISKTEGSTGLVELCMLVTVIMVTGCPPFRPNRLNGRTHLWSFLGPVTTERSLAGCGTGTVMGGRMPETRGTVMVVQEGIVVVVYSPAHLGEQHEGMGWSLTVIVLRYSSR